MMEQVALLRLSWPPQPLWPNRSRGKVWAARKDAEDAYKREGDIVARGQICTLKAISLVSDDPLITITFHKTDKGRFDLDNAYAALKPAQDAICARWGIDDSKLDRVNLRRGEPVKGGCVMIEVTG